MLKKPNVLILDIETSPITAYVFGLKEQNIGLNQIVRDWHIMCFSAKWLGEKKVIYKETRTSNDKPLLKALWELLDKADILVTQNGAHFDGPRIEARMMIHRMKPPSPYKHADTYRGNKNKGFTSHKLEYLTSVLNHKHVKLLHSNFPGMSLWSECLKGNNKAWAAMREYNIKDVLSTEELYLNTLPWASKTFPTPHVPINPVSKCPYCNSYVLRSIGIRRTKSEHYRRYICTQCGKSSKGDIYGN